MTADTISIANGDQRLDEAIAAFLKLAQLGRAPDREDWLARHPDLSTGLAEFFADRDAVGRLVEPVRAAVAGPRTLGPDNRSFGDCELLEETGRGGMGVVYKARQVSLNRMVALKMIRIGHRAAGADMHRFRTEAEAAASLDHPHIVPVYEVGEHDGQLYFTMKLIEGGSLAESSEDREQRTADRSKRSEISKEEQRRAARVLAAVARAVHYAHQRGVLHRDLKPSNILLDSDRQPYVSDFGLAKLAGGGQVDGVAALTETGVIVGTPSYMAPEQAADSKRLTTAADVYSLGAILYELVTGRPPFRADSPLETLRQVREREPVRPRALDARVNPDLETICLKCLEKDPERRYGSAESLADDLDRWLAGEPIRARAVGRAERSWRWCRRNPAAAAAGILAAVAFTALVALGVSSGFAVQLSQEQHRTQVALQLAEEQQGIAEQKGAEAERQRQRAADQEKLARHYLYGAHILLAQRAWDSNHVDLTLDYLERHRPQRGEADVRGFEWHYLWRRAHADLLTLETGTAGFTFTADGKHLHTPMPDGQVKVWDATTGREIIIRKEAQRQEGTSERMGSPDGQRVASGTKTGSIKVWDVATGQEVIALKGHDSEIRLLAFSPDGKRLASGARDMKTRKVWNLATGREIVTINHDLQPGHQTSLVFSPDGTRLASGSRDAVKLWDATTGQEVRSIEGRFGPITGIAFSPDGKRLAAGSQWLTALVWDATTGQELFTLKGHTSPVWSVSFSRDGKHLATGSKDATVKVWDMTTGNELATLRGHRGDVWKVAYSPDGTRLASGSADKTVKVWDVTAPVEGRTIKAHPSFIAAVAFRPDGQRLASVSFDSVWDEGQNRGIKKPGADQVHLSDIATGQRTLSLKSPSGFGGNVAFSPDGKQLVTDSKDGTIRIWDAGTGQEMRSFKEKSGIGNLAFSPDGKMLVFEGPDGIKLIDAATGKELLTSTTGRNVAGGIKFSPDGKRLTAPYAGMVNVLDTADWKVLLQLKGHTAYCIGVAFSPNRKWLASGSWDNTANCGMQARGGNFSR